MAQTLCFLNPLKPVAAHTRRLKMGNLQLMKTHLKSFPARILFPSSIIRHLLFSAHLSGISVLSIIQMALIGVVYELLLLDSSNLNWIYLITSLLTFLWMGTGLYLRVTKRGLSDENIPFWMTSRQPKSWRMILSLLDGKMYIRCFW